MAKILIISPTFPLPLQSGGQVRLFHVIRYLSHAHEVSLLSFALPRNERNLRITTTYLQTELSGPFR